MITNFAESAFAFSELQEKFEERLSGLAGNGEESGDFNRIGWDDYDKSLEIYEASPNFKLSPESRDFIFSNGFSKVYVNHTDGWETHYAPNQDPWRRRPDERESKPMLP